MAAILSRKATLGLGARAQKRNVAVRAGGADRPLWFPGNPAPAYLDGTLPGDHGYDPLHLSEEPEMRRWMVQAEVFHCRTAMLGAAGILIPEIGNRVGQESHAPGIVFPHWFEAGKVVADTGVWGNGTLFFTMMLLFGWAEHKRLYDWLKPGSQAVSWAWAPLGLGAILGQKEILQGKENAYPGGIFDPLGMSNGPNYRWMQEGEIKNGRLAMIAMIGFVSQHVAYPGKGPVDNLIDHIQDPTRVTFATNGISVPHYIEHATYAL